MCQKLHMIIANSAEGASLAKIKHEVQSSSSREGAIRADSNNSVQPIQSVVFQGHLPLPGVARIRRRQLNLVAEDHEMLAGSRNAFPFQFSGQLAESHSGREAKRSDVVATSQCYRKVPTRIVA